MESCLFCKIINGNIPSRKIYESEDAFAFLDINPRNPGHTLVIPKKHYRWVWDMPSEELGRFYQSVGKVANAQRKHFETEWIVSAISGDEVPHAHVWLVPRLPNDGHGAFLNVKKIQKIPAEEMDRIAEKLREQASKE